MTSELLRLDTVDWSNPDLPVLIYRGAMAVRGRADDAAAGFETLFEKNGWPPQWRNNYGRLQRSSGDSPRF